MNLQAIWSSSKLEIALQEADESLLWIELFDGKLRHNKRSVELAPA